MRIAPRREGPDLAEVGDAGPVGWRVTEQHAELPAGGQWPVDRPHCPAELLIHRLVPGLQWRLGGVPPDWAQLSVSDRLAGDEPVDRGLVERVAELHDNVIDHPGSLGSVSSRVRAS